MAVVVVALAETAAAQPQRGRQSPFSMGMRLLENIRDGMTSTLQNIFGGGSSRGNEVPPPRSVPPQAPNLDAAPPIVQKPESHPHHQEFHAPPPPQHHSPPSTSHVSSGAVLHFPPDPPASSFSSSPKGPTSSFFKVVHEQQDDKGFPDSHSFSDESFHPNTFLTGPPPFQGTVEEDHLVSIVHDPPRPLPLQHNHLPQDSFPPHKSATSFASFGNTASFKLGSLKRTEHDGHDGHAPLPRSILHDPPPPAADSPHHSLREDTMESSDHPTVILLSNSRLSTSEPATQASPPDTPAASLSFEDQRRQHHVAKKASASIKVQDAKGDFNPGSKIILGTHNTQDSASVSASPPAGTVFHL